MVNSEDKYNSIISFVVQLGLLQEYYIYPHRKQPYVENSQDKF